MAHIRNNLFDKVQYSEGFILPKLESFLFVGGRIFTLMGSENMSFRRNCALEADHQKKSTWKKVAKVIILCALLPLTMISLIFRQIGRMYYHVSLLDALLNTKKSNPSGKNAVDPATAPKPAEISITTPPENLEFDYNNREKMVKYILGSKVHKDLSEKHNRLIMNEMYQNVVCEILPDLVVGGFKSKDGIVRGYPDNLDDCFSKEGDLAIPSENLAPISSETGEGLFDVVVSNNAKRKYTIKHEENDGKTTSDAFGKKGYKHLIAEVTNEGMDMDAYIKAHKEVIQALKDGKSVYVHCDQGCDRSVTFITTLLFVLTGAFDNRDEEFKYTTDPSGNITIEQIRAFICSKRLVANKFHAPDLLNIDIIYRSFNKCVQCIKQNMPA
jgi:hypothetical protein